MKKLFVILSFLISLTCISSQSWGLPSCPTSGVKHNCYGTIIWKNGNKYVGEFQNNTGNGKGKYTHISGDIYVGEWKDMKRHGQGIQTWENGDQLKGEFKYNQRNGPGTYIAANGDIYVGEYKNGIANGQGIFTYENGKVKEGVWKDGKFLYAQKIEKNEKKYAEGIKPNTSSKELKRKLALLKKEQQSKPKNLVKTEPKSEFPMQPINVNFKSIPKRPDDIAVIIGNANYEKQGKDIPNVNPSYADAEGIKQYFMQALGVKEGNIIYLKDATGSQLLTVFGNQNTHKGQLFNWVKPNVSNVYVYYAGHGVPGGDKGNAYLVPTDANSQSIGLSGYPLEILYSNLGKLSAKSITVIIEACFSGASQAGNLFANSSPIVITAKKTMIPKNVKVISAGAVDQMASWEQDNSHGLFTKYFLKAMSGEGDKNNDGKVSDTELKNYLGETMTYYARRYYGRDQNVQIMQGN